MTLLRESIKKLLENLDAKLVHSGKIRDTFEHELLRNGSYLSVASDDISAFDFVLPCTIQYKGEVLTALTDYNGKYLEKLGISTHLVDRDILGAIFKALNLQDSLLHRTTLIKKCNMFAIEAIVRGYLLGSAWTAYQKSGEVCGIKLPPGLKEGSKLEEPIFTPSTKATEGHDINISFAEMIEICGEQEAIRIKELSLQCFSELSNLYENKGIILLDTKFEFGEKDGEIILCDEIGTPDSSRYALKEDYLKYIEEGGTLTSMDKEFVRQFAKKLGIHKLDPKNPEDRAKVLKMVFPDIISEGTKKRYMDILMIITGTDLFDYQDTHM